MRLGNFGGLALNHSRWREYTTNIKLLHRFTTGRITETADRFIKQLPNHEENISEPKEAPSFESCGKKPSQESIRVLFTELYLYYKGQS